MVFPSSPNLMLVRFLSVAAWSGSILYSLRSIRVRRYHQGPQTPAFAGLWLAERLARDGNICVTFRIL
jgi:hypothetical protein